MEAKDISIKQEAFLLLDNDNENDITRQNVGLVVQLNVRYKPSASVFFRLASHIIQPDHDDILSYLYITPDRLLSLQRIVYDANEDTNPSYLHTIRRKMGISGDVLRLQFTLDKPGDLVVPEGFDSGLGERDSSAYSFLSSSTALAFSLYMEPNVLPKASFSVFNRAIRQWAQATQGQKNKLGQLTDRRSLYTGKGGKLYRPEVPTATTATAAILSAHHSPLDEFPPPYGGKEPCHSQSSMASDVATIATDTPPRYYASLLGDRELQETRQSPAADRSDATTASADSPPGSLVPCGYQSISHTRKRRKRNLESDPDTDTNTCAKDRLRQFGKSRGACQSGPIAELDVQALVARVDQQQQQLREQQQQITQLLQQNREYQERCRELDERLFAVENEQGEAREDLELLSVEVGEVQSECADLRRQLPEVREQIEEWVAENMDAEVKKSTEALWEEETMSTGECFMAMATAKADELVKATIDKQLTERIMGIIGVQDGKGNEEDSQRMYQTIVNRVTVEVKEKIRRALEI